MYTFDVCVVGSGPGGGIAAYALAKAGLKTGLLEAGPNMRAGVDYGKHAMPWEVQEQSSPASGLVIPLLDCANRITSPRWAIAPTTVG